MNKHFSDIVNSRWMSSKDRDDFARYCYIYSKHIEPYYGCFDWENVSFVHFCNMNKIRKKGKKCNTCKMNHIWFDAKKPKNKDVNDVAHHFMRHVRNAFAHGQIEVSFKGHARRKYYLFKDFDNKGQTMGAFIRSDLLWSMLWLLFQTRIAVVSRPEKGDL